MHFGQLGAYALERSCEPPHRETELLRRGIEMVKLERAWIAVISTRQAPAALLGNELRLGTSSPLRDGVQPALTATVVPPPLEDEAALAVRRAKSYYLFRLGCRGRRRLRRGPRELMALEPIPNGRDADAELECHLGKRESRLHERFQRSLRDPALGRILLSVHRRQLVLSQPVPDSRGMLSCPLPDRLERHPRGEIRLEDLSIHCHMLARAPDRKRTYVRGYLLPCPKLLSAESTALTPPAP